MSFFKKISKGITKAATSVKNTFVPPPKPSPLSDEEWNRRIYAKIHTNEDSINNNHSYIRKTTKEISDLYKQLRNINRQATAGAPCAANEAMLKSLISQLAYYKAQLEIAKRDLAKSVLEIQQLFNQLQPLKDSAISNNILIQDLQKQLTEETILYNKAQLEVGYAYDAARQAQFNQSVSETQKIITDLNSPYVKHGDDLVAMLSKYIPKSNADTTYAKIEYRDVEFANLKNTNIIINIVYYIGVIILFVLLFTSNNVFLKERFIFYILLILLPLLYPWIYLYISKIWQYIFPTTLFSGPKNAFIDQSTQPNVYDI